MHAIVRKSLVGEWAKKVADPQTDIERALAGCYWSLDDFEVVKVLGGGNYGRAMLVRLKTDPRIRFVMKVETFSYADFIKYVCGEAIEGSKVRHVNIIKTFGFFPVSTVCEKNKPICMALMQELGGDSLRGEVGSLEKLEPHEKFPQVINIMDGIIAAVHALERAGVVHRDIKLENIVMGEGGVPKLVDFGLARMYDEDDNMTENVGAGPYIPPEGQGPKHDSFSAAAVFFELMTGAVPSTKELTRDDVAEAFEAYATVNGGKEAIDLCANMIQSDPNERYTAQQAATAMQKILTSVSK